MAGKKTKGRQKIEMKRIENEEDRLITFSKRRSGIYKKASKLATLCGAEVGFVVFSPSGKPFSFGHPSIESVVNRFKGIIPFANDNTQNIIDAHRQRRINELTHQYNELLSQLEAEKEREKTLKQLTKDQESAGWWQAPIEMLNLHELQQLQAKFDNLHINLLDKMRVRSALGASSSSLPAMNPVPGPNPFRPNASGTHPATFPPGYGFGPTPHPCPVAIPRPNVLVLTSTKILSLFNEKL